MLKKVSTVFTIFLFASFIVSTSFASEIPSCVMEIMNDVKSHYCPDKRISVFDIEAELSNDTLTLRGEVLETAAKADLLKKIRSLNSYIINDRISILPDKHVQQQPFGVIRLSVAQLRRGPDVDQEMISQAIMGSEIRILKTSGYFYYCQMEDRYLGWMMRSSFEAGNDDFIERWRTRPKVIVTDLHGQVFIKKSHDSTPVSDLVRGNKLIKLGSSWKWYHVELPDGRRGYIRKSIAMDEAKQKEKFPATADAIIKTAQSVYGVPYFWGGISIKGFDCSGFTQSTFKFHGIQLQRDANMQVKQGTAVSMNDNLKHLQPGDLLFFGRDPNRITHVGLYIGDSQFIHADGFVHTNSFDPDHDNFSEYRRQGLRAVRRILKD